MQTSSSGPTWADVGHCTPNEGSQGGLRTSRIEGSVSIYVRWPVLLLRLRGGERGGVLTQPTSNASGQSSRVQEVADGLPHAAVLNDIKAMNMKEMNERDRGPSGWVWM